jgi:hypothetical protein
VGWVVEDFLGGWVIVVIRQEDGFNDHYGKSDM